MNIIKISKKLLVNTGLAVLMSAASVVGAHAVTTGDPVVIPDAAAYSGSITGTQTYVTSLISSYGNPALIASMAVTGLFFVWRLAKKVFH